jgi:hypothetical protein
MSFPIQTIDNKINKLVIIPKGLIKTDLVNSPLKSNKVALVEPQEGHGSPVIFLKIQKELLEKMVEKKSKKYPDINEKIITRYLNL